MLSVIVLILTYLQFGSILQLGNSEDPAQHRNELKLLTHNVRLFNAYEENVDMEKVAADIAAMFDSHDPEVVILQEYYKPHSVDFSEYPYQFIHFKDDHKLGHAIFSKFPIAGRGAFDFEGTSNNSIYADIVKNGDTVRIYNLHLQSMGILPDVEYLQEGDKDRIRYRMANTFRAQANQVQKIIEHSKTSPYPAIYAGDFNNTQFSYIYKKLAREKKDAFKEKGQGLGTTFWFDFYPMRIDYVLCPDTFDVKSFEIPSTSTSDHFAIVTQLGWPTVLE